MKKKEKLDVAIYCRLSKEDGDSEVSDSIENQKNALLEKANENDWNIYNIYTDDGYTGLNMDRPDFQRMKKDIELGNIDIILVKNQSRIGRDNSDVDKFLNKYLIERRVRCLGLTDNLDNMNKHSKKSSQINGLVNEWYSEDISNNVRFAQDTLRLRGKFIGSNAPYGYIKNPEDKHQLIIDEEIKPIIKKIYSLYLDGYGYTRIAKSLNDDEIPCPSEYKKVFNYNRSRIKKSQWSYSTVRTILLNEVYVGHMIQKKTETVSYKSNKRIVHDEDARIKVLDTHESIISQKEFDMVQDRIKKVKYSKPIFDSLDGIKRKHILAGIVTCGDCGRSLRYRNDTQKFNCATYTTYGKGTCTAHQISLIDLSAILLNEIKSVIKLYAEMKRILDIKNKYLNTKEKKDSINIQLSKTQKKYNEIENLQESLIEKYLMGKIEEDLYNKMSEKYKLEKENISKTLEDYNNQFNSYEKIIERQDGWDIIVKKYINIKELNREIINDLVDRITVTQDEEGDLDVHIQFKYSSPFVNEYNPYEDNTAMGRYNVGTKFLNFIKQGNSNVANELNILYHTYSEVI